MTCPYCSNLETRVLDKRDTANHEATRRRRECTKCGKRFTTYERVEIDLIVVKKDGTREQFDRNKLKTGILKACEKRPISHDQIESMIDKIEAELRSMDSMEVNSKTVGNVVMKHLKKLDKVAYIRFASVYREFTDVESFDRELKKLLKKT